MSDNTAAVPALNLRATVYCALFTALIIVGGYISIPIPVGPVPIVLADFFVMTAGLFLGWKYGFICALLYVCLGVSGLPVFAGGKAGLAVLLGPTGGFLFGYPVMAACIGFISEKMKISVVTNIFALISGNILLYLFGVPRLKAVANLGWHKAFMIGLVPFIPGLIIKIAAATALGRIFLPHFRKTALQIPCESVQDTADNDKNEE